MDTTNRCYPASFDGLSPSHCVSLVYSFATQVSAVALREREPLSVGRSEPSQLVIEDRSLSRVHARFWLEEGRVSVEDCGSTNGTFVDGHRIGRARTELQRSARLGSVEFQVAGATNSLERVPREDVDLAGALSLELERQRYFGRSLALCAVSGAADQMSRIARVLRPVDRLEHYAPQLSLVLLPEAGEVEVRALVSSLAAGALRVSAVIVPRAAGSAETLIAQVVDHARRASSVLEIAQVARAKPGEEKPIVLAENMLRVHALIGSAARTDIPVLIVGETGTGKESLAFSLHERSGRSMQPYRAVNCAALTGSLLSSTLFGHERGAFTGAERQHLGLFEQARRGTLFLDEVGELPLEAQAALLRVLETQRVLRVGAQREVEVDVRVVAATHRDLPGMVAAGTFRKDLLYRLDAFTVRVPPLRERVEEIAPLAQLFLERSCVRWQTTATRISQAALLRLEAYPWPGNVRELRNVVERAATVCSGSTIELDDLPDALFSHSEARGPDVATRPPLAGRPARATSLPERLRTFETEIIREALGRTGGNQSEAARLLGLPRRTLAHKVHAFGLAEYRADKDEEAVTS